MLVRSLPLTQPLTLTPTPLDRAAFAPFGDVIANPRPDATPGKTSSDAIARGEFPCAAVSTNQGTAIQYRGIGAMQDLYGEAPSGKVGSPRMTMFVCGARASLSLSTQTEGEEKEGEGNEVPLAVLERHPFTSQTFIPLTADTTKRYLVVVAPTLDSNEEDLPSPQATGNGLPDLDGIKAFVARGDQAVTYRAGTWHAPMIALGPEGSTVDFVVVQFANEEPVEDCQEVGLEERIVVRV